MLAPTPARSHRTGQNTAWATLSRRFVAIQEQCWLRLRPGVTELDRTLHGRLCRDVLWQYKSNAGSDSGQESPNWTEHCMGDSVATFCGNTRAMLAPTPARSHRTGQNTAWATLSRRFVAIQEQCWLRLRPGVTELDRTLHGRLCRDVLWQYKSNAGSDSGQESPNWTEHCMG